MTRRQKEVARAFLSCPPYTHEAIITHETFDRVQALLLHLQDPLPDGLHDALYQAQPSGGRRLFDIQYQVGIAVSYSEMIAHINTALMKKSNPTALTTK